MFIPLLLALCCLLATHATAFSTPATTDRVATKLSVVVVDRRSLLAALVTVVPTAATALNTIPADNEFVKEQRTVVGQLDVNNSPVADYMKYPGLYPTIGGKIANGGPYQKVSDVFQLQTLTQAEKAKLKEYQGQLTATKAMGLDTMRGRDPYRHNFNDFFEVKPE